MGRKRIEMKYIEKEKQRKATFKIRSKGLKKKAYELATLCGVPVCLVMYQGPNSEPEMFPASQDEVRAILNRYSGSCNKSESSKALFSPDLDGLGIQELAGLSQFLDNKLQAVTDKIARLRGDTSTSAGGDAGGGIDHGMQQLAAGDVDGMQWPWQPCLADPTAAGMDGVGCSFHPDQLEGSADWLQSELFENPCLIDCSQGSQYWYDEPTSCW